MNDFLETPKPENGIEFTDEELEEIYNNKTLVLIPIDLKELSKKTPWGSAGTNDSDIDVDDRYDFSKKTKTGRPRVKCPECKTPNGARTTKSMNDFYIVFFYKCKKCNASYKESRQEIPFFPKIEQSKCEINSYFTVNHVRFWWSAIVSKYRRKHKEQTENIERLREELALAEIKLDKIRSDYVLLHEIAFDETKNIINDQDKERMFNAWSDH